MKIIIVDDHVLFREGLASIFQQESDIEVIDLVGNVKDAIDSVTRLKPDIVLLDFSLPDGTGADAAQKITQETPDCKIIFLTMSDTDESLFAAIRSGAKGYLLKNMSPSKLISSLRSVQRGESALSRSMTLRLMRELSRTKESDNSGEPVLEKLTSREREILVELAAKKSNKEIALQLVLSVNTVKYHVHSILEKLNLTDRKEAARFAKEHGVK